MDKRGTFRHCANTDAPIVSMVCDHDGDFIVATSESLYRIRRGRLEEMQLTAHDPDRDDEDEEGVRPPAGPPQRPQRIARCQKNDGMCARPEGHDGTCYDEHIPL